MGLMAYAASVAPDLLAHPHSLVVSYTVHYKVTQALTSTFGTYPEYRAGADFDPALTHRHSALVPNIKLERMSSLI
ncbi:hypothetical protein DPMN_063344 [Dreissena polymorpha]|uniref:Uncharacterized protein n=1 Tax=Dreissena polymorpha TaxID=45954 RepID=A0A9D4CAT7_DREPO|nr:hypothetical protein DPMN_063344 [Dreissena polymorpha]